MQDFNSEFDKEIRSMLAAAEEEVPSHLKDEVFARLDAKHKAVLPVWLKRTAAVMAAAAAVVAGFVMLFPGADGRKTAGDDIITAEAAVPSQDLEQNDKTADIENLTAMAEPVRQQAASVKPGMKHSDEPSVVSYLEQEPEAEPVTGSSESADEHRDAVEAGGNDAEERQKGALDDYFESLPDEESAGRRISMAVGGELASNGNAKGFSGFGGMRAPGDGIMEATYIEQTGKNSRYMIPLSFGVTARIPFAKRWAVGAGVNYTLLQRTFAGVYTNIHEGRTTTVTSSDIKNTIHYIGIPVNVYYDILEGSKIKFYAYAGGSVEKGIASTYRISQSSGNISYREKVKGVQASAGIGLGVEFALADKLGLYINPGIRYYFDCGQPVSIRTQQPLMMNFEIGFRVGI